MYYIYDFVDGNAINTFAVWMRKLQKTQRIKLQSKIDMLAQHGPNLSPQLLAGPIYEHIYKLRVRGNVELRPMLCKGPLNNEIEFTLLLGAFEIQGELDPPDAPETATKLRAEIIKNHTRRCLHERID